MLHNIKKYVTDGTDKYVFCTKTNRFKGFRNGKEPQRRERLINRF